MSATQSFSIQERAETVGYLEKMRDQASEMLRGSGWPQDNPNRKMWQERFEMCNRAVKILAEAKP